jgi:hypothetical protein
MFTAPVSVTARNPNGIAFFRKNAYTKLLDAAGLSPDQITSGGKVSLFYPGFIEPSTVGFSRRKTGTKGLNCMAYPPANFTDLFHSGFDFEQKNGQVFIVGRGVRPETDAEKLERERREFEAAKKVLEAKIEKQERELRKEREWRERKQGDPFKSINMENLVVLDFQQKLLNFGLDKLASKVRRTSPLAPGYDIVFFDETGKELHGEVKPKHDTGLTKNEGRYANEHQDDWRLVTVDENGKIEIFTFADGLMRKRMKESWKFYPIRVSGVS